MGFRCQIDIHQWDPAQHSRIDRGEGGQKEEEVEEHGRVKSQSSDEQGEGFDGEEDKDEY